MLSALVWLLTAEVVGLAAFPIAYRLLPSLRDRGYAVSKPLGLLLVGYASWILSQTHLVPSVRPTHVALLLAMGALSAWLVRRDARDFVAFLRMERAAILTAEAVFVTLFVGWALYRAYVPAITHTEQPMDFALLNASLRTFTGPPQDPWLSGHAVSYYYFGHWMAASLAKMAGVAPAVAYNLALALVPAMAGAGAFGLVYNLVSSLAHRRRREALVAGLAAALLLTVAANLEGVLELMHATGAGSAAFWSWVGIDGLSGNAADVVQGWRPTDHWWWWRATRVINTFVGGSGVDYTIQEFPAFSFILGDLHAHVLSLPLVLLFLAFCFNFLSAASGGGPALRRRAASAGAWRRRLGAGGRRVAGLAPMGLALGGLGFTNVWDLPVFGGMFVGVVFVRALMARGVALVRRAAEAGLAALAVIGLAFGLFAPYFAGFSSQFTGIHPVGEAVTRPFHMLVVWGLLLAAAAPLVLNVYWSTTVKPTWRRLAALSVAVPLVLYAAWAFLHLDGGGSTGDLWGRFVHVFPLALLVAVAVYSALWLAEEGVAPGRVFAMMVAALGLLLILVPELVFVGDFFGTRMNTVFKFYYEAWVLLSLAAGFAVFQWRSASLHASGWRRLGMDAWALVFLVLLAGSVYYTLAASASRADGSRAGATLDGLRFLVPSDQGEYDAIAFLAREAGRGATMVEAVGDDYSDFGRVSAATGVPTILGWQGHELQWRGSSEPFAGRAEDVAAIYQTDDVAHAEALLVRYNVEYVYVGRRERQKYGEDGLGKFAAFMDQVFDRGGVQVYRARR